jgi:hypothetical protein
MDSHYEIGHVERWNRAFKRGMSSLLSTTVSEGDMVFRLQNSHNISNKYYLILYQVLQCDSTV